MSTTRAAAAKQARAQAEPAKLARDRARKDAKSSASSTQARPRKKVRIVAPQETTESDSGSTPIETTQADTFMVSSDEDSDDEPLILKSNASITSGNYTSTLGMVAKKNDKVATPFWKMRFNASQKQGSLESVRTLTLDYIMAGFRNASHKPDESNHPLAEEFCKVRDRLMQVWEEIASSQKDGIAQTASTKAEPERKGYVSESAYIRRIKRQVNAAAEEYIRQRTEGGNVGHTVKEPGNLLPTKEDIMVLRYLDPTTFNGKIAAQLAMLKRVDLMVIGSMPEAEARSNFMSGIDEDLKRKVEGDQVNYILEALEKKLKARINDLDERVNGMTEVYNKLETTVGAHGRAIKSTKGVLKTLAMTMEYSVHDSDEMLVEETPSKSPHVRSILKTGSSRPESAPEP